MNLPPCHARQPLGDARDLFLCLHPKVVARGNRVTAGNCQACRHSHEPPPETLRDPSTLPRDPVRSPCVYLGAEIGRRACITCRGCVQVKVFACAHPACTETTLRGCLGCAWYSPRSILTPDRSSLLTSKG